MKFALSEQTLSRGRENQQAQQDVPSQQNRMAGDRMRDFAERMKHADKDKEAQDWNSRFSMSNEGAAFNMAKMNGGQMPGTEGEGEMQ